MASIKQRPHGKWRPRYRDDDGQEHSRHFERKRDGQAWLDEVASSRLTGTYVAPAASRVTLAGFYADWAPRQQWATGTRKNADWAVDSCTFRDVPFGKLRRSHVESWVKSMESALAPSTIQTRVRYVGGVLKGAVLDRALAVDPSVGVRLPQVRRLEHTMRIPTPAEVQAVLGDPRELAPRPGGFDGHGLCGLPASSPGVRAAAVVVDAARSLAPRDVARQIQQPPGRARDLPPAPAKPR